jgi:hypothetical protein
MYRKQMIVPRRMGGSDAAGFGANGSESSYAAVDDCPVGTRPAVSRRCVVLFEQPHAVAACRTVRPSGAGRQLTSSRSAKLLYLALARAKPARTRSTILSLSKAAMAKLGREVLLKILPVSFTNDPDRVARFRREVQVPKEKTAVGRHWEACVRA